MGCPSNIFYQTTCKVQAWGAAKALFRRNIMEGMWGKGVWKWVKVKTSSGRSNNASEGVDENVWEVHTVTKCAREEPSQEEERGKSPIQLFVRVL
jgi:hypothetical protein